MSVYVLVNISNHKITFIEFASERKKVPRGVGPNRSTS